MLPNICAGVTSAAFVSVALVLGEYTFASLLNFNTMPAVIALLGKSDAPTVVAGALASLVFAAFLLRAALVRGPPHPYRRKGPDVTVLHTTREPKGTGAGVSLVDLRRTYGSLNALDGLTWTSRRARWWCCSGPRGAARPPPCGSSPGWTGPTRARCVVGGEDISRSPRTSATWAWCSRPTACSRT